MISCNLIANGVILIQGGWGRGHLIHFNVNSLLPKANEPRDIAKLSNAVVIGFSQSKLNDWIFSSEI